MADLTPDELLKKVTMDRTCPRDGTALRITDASAFAGRIDVRLECPTCGAVITEMYPLAAAPISNDD